MIDSPFTLILSLFFIGFGIHGIIRKQIAVGLGRGRPLGTIELTRHSAVIFGITCVISGLSLSLPSTYRFLTTKSPDVLLTAISVGVGLSLPIIGFLFGVVLQLAMSFQPPRQTDSSSEDNISQNR